MSDTPIPVDNTPTDASFLAAFTEFNDAGRYPAPLRTLWLNIASESFSPTVWGQFYEIGVYLWTAHHLALFGNQQRRRTSRGNNPNAPPLVNTSKSVGGVSLGYDVASVTVQGAGHWNATTYGIRLYEMMRMVGAGGDIVGYGAYRSGGALGYVGPLPHL